MNEYTVYYHLLLLRNDLSFMKHYLRYNILEKKALYKVLHDVYFRFKDLYLLDQHQHHTSTRSPALSPCMIL